MGEEKEEEMYTYPCLETDEVAAEGACLVGEFIREVDHESLLGHAEGVAMRLVGDLKMAFEDSMGVAHVVKSLKAYLDESQKEPCEVKTDLDIRNALLEAEKECSIAAVARADELAKELDICKRQTTLDSKDARLEMMISGLQKKSLKCTVLQSQQQRQMFPAQKRMKLAVL